MFDATSDRFARFPSNVSSVVFPQRFSGDTIPMYTVTLLAANAYVCTTHNASASAAIGGSTTYRWITPRNSSNNFPPSILLGGRESPRAVCSGARPPSSAVPLSLVRERAGVRVSPFPFWLELGTSDLDFSATPGALSECPGG